MKALAWDDEPGLYIDYLKPELARRGIELQIESDVAVFLERVDRESGWDFITTDLLNEVSPSVRGKETVDSVRISTQLAGRFPLFLITTDPARAFELPIPSSVIIKSKDLPPHWMAREISDHLLQLGVPDRRRVFIAYGQNSDVNDRLESYLKSLGVGEIVKLTQADVVNDLRKGVLAKMANCAAIIAVCTPDDAQPDGTFRARQNVVLEMGMALALPRGTERLVVLRQDGDAPETKVEMASDMAGVLELRYANDVSEAFDHLKDRLVTLRVDMQGN